MVKLNSVARSHRVVLIGAGGVGKTSLLKRFLGKPTGSGYEPTVQDCYRQLIQLSDGMTGTIEIIDTAGQYQFPAMRTLSVSTAEAIILVFSVTSRESFDEAIRLYQQIRDIKGNEPKVPTLLMGNKTDLSSQREVTREEVTEALAAAGVGANCGYVETSATSGADLHITCAFHQLYGQLVDQGGPTVAASPRLGAAFRPRAKTMPHSKSYSISGVGAAVRRSIPTPMDTVVAEDKVRSNSMSRSLGAPVEGARSGSSRDADLRKKSSGSSTSNSSSHSTGSMLRMLATACHSGGGGKSGDIQADVSSITSSTSYSDDITLGLTPTPTTTTAVHLEDNNNDTSLLEAASPPPQHGKRRRSPAALMCLQQAASTELEPQPPLVIATSTSASKCIIL